MAVEKNTLHCSFCGKSEDEVKKLIAGPVVFICDECTIQCLHLLVDCQLPLDALSREAELLRRESLVNETVSLIDSMLEQERIRRRPIDLLEKKLKEIGRPIAAKTDVFSGQ